MVYVSENTVCFTYRTGSTRSVGSHGRSIEWWRNRGKAEVDAPGRPEADAPDRAVVQPLVVEPLVVESQELPVVSNLQTLAQNLDESCSIMCSWWNKYGQYSQNLQSTYGYAGVKNNLLSRMQLLNGNFGSVMGNLRTGCWWRGADVSLDGIYQLTLDIIKQQGVNNTNFNEEFWIYMRAVRDVHSKIYNHLH
jgi:hypothetical protein